MVNVIGNSKASAASGPTPGSTPTSVPIRLPRKQKKRLSSVRMTPKPVSSPPTDSMPHQPHGPRGSAMPSMWPNNQSTITMATKASASENHQLDFSTVRSRMTIVMKPATANPRNGMLIAMKASPAMTPRTRHSASPRGKSGAIVSLNGRTHDDQAGNKREQTAFGTGRADQAERPRIGRRGSPEQNPECVERALEHGRWPEQDGHRGRAWRYAAGAPTKSSRKFTLGDYNTNSVAGSIRCMWLRFA